MTARLMAKASAFALASAFAGGAAFAQDAPPPPKGAVGAFTEEVLVTAQKKADAEDVQDVPLAVTAYGDAQLDALKVRDLQNLSYAVPNVQFEDIGTAKGIANFSIRGLGVNSSIPSIDPAVGTFIDGVYLGTNAGVVMDIFDLDSVEVLRGPQGILFGRNVTGGAVLISTKKPNLDKFEANFKGSVDSGFRGTGANYTAQGAVSVPLIRDTLGFRLTGYYNSDKGWHKRYLGGPNLVNSVLAGGGTNRLLQLGSPLVGGVARPIAVNQPDAYENFGVSETWSIKPQLLWRPTDAVELRLQYQRFQSQGDGPAAQNHSGFTQPPFNVATQTTPAPVPSTNIYFSAPKDSFTFSINEPGFYEQKLDAVTADLSIDVPNGTITNVFGWRNFRSDTFSDIDATPLWLFHSGARTEFSQISNEIRYAGEWFGDRLQTTVGFYYYSSDLGYDEYRFLLGGFRNLYGGGNVDSRNYGVFGQAEFKLTDSISLIGGARYTNEKKDAQVANITNATRCSAIAATCPFQLVDTFTWKNVTPKAAIQWTPRDDFQAYVSWTEGVRSGGYNVRHTAPLIPNRRFDEETVDTYELGFKAQPDGRAVVNFAIFVSDISNMQRELNLADPVAGVVQLIRNTADATIFGMELETRYSITDNLIFTGNIGRLDGTYDRVFFDLNSDGVVNATDKQLEIPRLAPWTYGAGFIHTLPVGALGTIDTRFGWSHRDANAYTDNNLGILKAADIFDLSVGLNMEKASISLYGQNLGNDVTHGGETQLPASLGGGTFAPLNKGRVIGIELQLKL